VVAVRLVALHRNRGTARVDADTGRDQLAALSNDKKRDFLSVVALALSHQAASVLDAVQEL
jgi:hypothetical protein